MNSPTNWEFFKQDQDKTIWVHICTEDLDGISISINNWWKRRYPDYKIRVVSKNEFEQKTCHRITATIKLIFGKF